MLRKFIPRRVALARRRFARKIACLISVDSRNALVNLDQERQINKVYRRNIGELRLEINNLTQELANYKSLDFNPVGCGKIRLPDKETAWKFAAKVADDNGASMLTYKVYRCNVCGVQPLGVNRWWHISSGLTDKEKEALKLARRSRKDRSTNSFADKIDPKTMTLLDKFKD